MSQSNAGTRGTGATRDGRTGERTTTRRQLLGSTATLVAGGIVTATLASQVEAATIPYVSTRGHFDIDDRFWGDDDVSLTDGHSTYDYDVEGTVPGLDDGSIDEICLWIHGWRNDLDDATTNFTEGRSVLRKNGYEKPIVGYT